VKAPEGVTLHAVAPAGSGRYSVVHNPCGKRIGSIAGTTRGWRYGYGPMSARAKHAPRADSMGAAAAGVLHHHTCPGPS
jgi:hypothetical protein